MIPRRRSCVRSRVMSGTDGAAVSDGLSLAPFRGLRPQVDSNRLGRLLSPPYDVIDPRTRAQLIQRDPENAVSVVLPDPSPAGYAAAAAKLDRWVSEGLYSVDPAPALYVYEMGDPDGNVTRGLLGAVELRAAEDGVILPHENTMAGPVADRLEVMTATGTDLEPIYLVYDGGGPASELLKTVESQATVAEATTPDGVRHRLWSVTDPAALQTVAEDLATRRALIADGHHRYATYQERQRQRRAADGAGPWDRGLALVVDSSEYGPQVHAIHRVIGGLTLANAVEAVAGWAAAERVGTSPAETLAALDEFRGFAAVLTDGTTSFILADVDRKLAAAAGRPGDVDALTDLDVTVLHRALVEEVWKLNDDETT